MLIKFASRGDVADIAQIEQESWSPWSIQQVEAELKQENGICLIATQDSGEKAIGWCCARYIQAEAELLKIALLSHHRRSGIGSLLFAELSRLCFQAGCSVIYLEVREKNLTARSFYHHLGFVRHAQRKNYYHDPPDNGIILKKNLHQST